MKSLVNCFFVFLIFAHTYAVCLEAVNETSYSEICKSLQTDEFNKNYIDLLSQAEEGERKSIEKLYNQAYKCNDEGAVKYIVALGAAKQIPWFVIFFSENYTDTDYLSKVSIFKLKRIIAATVDDSLAQRAHGSLAALYLKKKKYRNYALHLAASSIYGSVTSASELIRYCDDMGNKKCVYIWGVVQLTRLKKSAKYYEDLREIVREKARESEPGWDLVAKKIIESQNNRELASDLFARHEFFLGEI